MRAETVCRLCAADCAPQTVCRAHSSLGAPSPSGKLSPKRPITLLRAKFGLLRRNLGPKSADCASAARPQTLRASARVKGCLLGGRRRAATSGSKWARPRSGPLERQMWPSLGALVLGAAPTSSRGQSIAARRPIGGGRRVHRRTQTTDDCQFASQADEAAQEKQANDH